MTPKTPTPKSSLQQQIEAAAVEFANENFIAPTAYEILLITNAMLAAANITIKDQMKQYSDSSNAIVQRAMEFAEEKKAQGWTKDDAANALKNMLKSDTGD